MSEALIVYNLFPRLVGTLDRWSKHLVRAQALGCNAVYINPFHYPGFSGSLYAVKDYFRINPSFVPADTPDPLQRLGQVVQEARRLGLRPIMDLVVNHTAVDADLVKEHPDWYRRDAAGELLHPSAIDPADARRVTVWGDLADIDNAASPDRERLWQYWADLVRIYLELGFGGFRCDAAYQVPMALWTYLIEAARRVRPDTLFLAETLGCRTEQVRQFAGIGFDYLFNSAKWWNFDAPWCLEQHETYRHIAPSIGFPESHDTPRLAADTGGLLRVQRQRYAFVAAYGAGLMLPIGFEYGFDKALNVVHMTPDDWQTPRFDLSVFLRTVHDCKRRLSPLSQEGRFTWHSALDQATLILRKEAADGRAVFIVINKDWHQGQTARLPEWAVWHAPGGLQALRVCRDGCPTETIRDSIGLEPAEVVYALAEPQDLSVGGH